MKRVVLLLGLLLISGIFILGAQDTDFGPESWKQYRMDATKNAVFNNDSDPLEYTEFATANEVRATPVVAENALYVGNHETGELFAFDIQSGDKIWENEAPNWIHSEMIYHAGQMFVGFGNRYFQGNGVRGTEESGVLSLDAETGEVLWKYNTEGEVMPTPIYHEGDIYAATGDRALYQLDAASGELVRKEDLGSVVSMSSPAKKNQVLYVGGGSPKPYKFSAYSLEKGKVLWQTDFPEVFAGLDDVPPAISDHIVVTTGLTGDSETPEHWIYAMDTRSGELVWKDSLGTGDFVKNNKSGAPMIYKGNIYVGSPITQTFYAYDLETGQQLWSFENKVMKAPPVAQDGIVYFSNVEGEIYALDAENGQEQGKVKLEGTLAPSGPIIMNDTLIIGSQDSNVYAVPLTQFN